MLVPWAEAAVQFFSIPQIYPGLLVLKIVILSFYGNGRGSDDRISFLGVL